MMPKKVKILFLCPSLQGGGAERFMSTLVNHLDTEKFDITLAIVDNKEQFYQIDTTRVRLIDLKTPYIKHAFPKVFRLLWHEKPDIVFSNMTKLNVFISVFRPFFPSKTRFIARETIVLSIDVKYSFPKQAKFIKGLIRRFYGRFDKIVCQSEDMKNDLVSHFAQDVTKTIVINNPIDVVSIQKQIAKVGKESQQVPRLVSVGRLAPQKGFDRLLQAVSQLPIDFRFDIIGEGAEHERLIELVQKLGITEKVRFLGQLQNPFYIAGSNDGERVLELT